LTPATSAREISSSSHSELVGLPPDDLESGSVTAKCEAAIRRLSGDHAGAMHYAVYSFSIVIFLTGLVEWIFPAEGFFDKICGTLLFICGIFLMVNSDLVVTCIRMQHEVYRFKRNNGKLEKNTQRLGKKVRELHVAQKGLQDLDIGYKGTAQDAQRKIDQLKSAARSGITNVAKHICHLYGDVSKDRKINLGPELKNTLEMLGVVFGGVYEDFPERAKVLQETIERNPKCQSEGGLEDSKFAQLLPVALDPNYASALKPALEKLLRGEVLGGELEAKAPELASGKPRTSMPAFLGGRKK